MTAKKENYTLMKKKKNMKKKEGEKLSTTELNIAKQKQNREIKGRLRSLIDSWKHEGGEGNYLSNDAIADLFRESTGIDLQGRTVRNYITESNPDAVPLPFLCWCAEKRGVSLDYLVTGKDRPSKASGNTSVTAAADVLDALRLILETFWGSPVLEFEPYEQEIACYDRYQELLTITTETFFSMSINSEVIQHLIKCWVRMVEITEERLADNREDETEELKELLFVSEFEKYRNYYDSVSETTGVFYEAAENPVFIKPAFSHAVPAVVSRDLLPPIKDIKCFSEYGEPLGDVIAVPDLKIIKNKEQKERDGETE